MSRHFPPSEPTFEPTPTRSRPHFEENAPPLSILPLARIERGGLVPRAWGNRWTLGELLPFGCRFLLLALPLLEMGKEGTSGAKSGMNGSAAEHRRKVFSDLGKRHHGMRVLLRGMCKLFQSGQGLFIGQV